MQNTQALPPIDISDQPESAWADHSDHRLKVLYENIELVMKFIVSEKQVTIWTNKIRLD